MLGPHDDPRPVALLRIGLGLCLLLDVGALWPLADLLYADEGILPRVRACGELPGRLSLLCHAPDTVVPALFVAVGIVGLALTLGLATRIAAVLSTVGFASLLLRNPVVAAGDQILWCYLFLLCLSRCGEVWSVDAWWRARRPGGRPPRRIPGWPRALMIVQLGVLYGANGWNKGGRNWDEGNTLAYMLMNDRWFRFEPWWLLSHAEPLLRVGTWVALWFERLFPLVVLAAVARAVLEARESDAVRSRASSPLRSVLHWVLRWPLGPWPWLAMTVLLHGTLIVWLNLGWFVPATLVVGLCLLPRLPWTRPSPETTPSVLGRGARAARVGAAAVLVWHTLAMVQVALPPPARAATPILAASLDWWRVHTNTRQTWRMFDRGAPRRARYLRACGLDGEGACAPIIIGMGIDWHRAPKRPYIGLERGRKVGARILGSPKWQRLFARWLCRSTTDPAGRPWATVVLEREEQPLPDPRWMAEHGPVDPYDRFADHRTVRPIVEHECASDDGVAAFPSG